MLMMLKNQLDKSTISYYRIQLCSPTISKLHLSNRPKTISTTSKLKLIFSSRDSQTSPSSNYMTKQMSISTLLVYKILKLRTRLFLASSWWDQLIQVQGWVILTDHKCATSECSPETHRPRGLLQRSERRIYSGCKARKKCRRLKDGLGNFQCLAGIKQKSKIGLTISPVLSERINGYHSSCYLSWYSIVWKVSYHDQKCYISFIPWSLDQILNWPNTPHRPPLQQSVKICIPYSLMGFGNKLPNK